MKINKRILSIIMSIFLTFTLINTNTVFAFATNDLIPDASLRASILEALNQSSDYQITKEDLSKISVLNADDYDISSLKGLEYCTNLSFLSLSNNKINDLSPLKNLTQLTQLSLKNNNITNIAPLSGLTNQLSFNLETDKTISFEFNQKVSIGTATSTFSGSVSKNIIIDSPAVTIYDSNLKSILLNKLGKDQNYEIKAKDLSTITELNADDKNITSLSGLEYCTNLTSLSLKSNNISDIKELSKSCM